EEPARLQDHTYWQIDFPDEGRELSEHASTRLVDRFEAVLYRAVERRLRADVPVVSYLSGGVDSSIVVAMASKVLGSPIPTFTVQVQDPELDEPPHALHVSRQVGSPPQVVPYAAGDMLREYPRLIRAAEAPVIDTSAAASLLLAQRVNAHGFKVALTGEGSDEWQAGYPWFAGVHGVGFLRSAPGGSRVGRAIRLHLRLLRAPRGAYNLVRQAEKTLGGHNVWLAWTTLLSLSRLRLFSREMKERLVEHEPFADLEL